MNQKSNLSSAKTWSCFSAGSAVLVLTLIFLGSPLLVSEVAGEEDSIVVKTEDESSSVTLIICPEGFDQALQPWIKFREEQGYNLVVHRPKRTSFEMNQLVRTVASRHKIDHIVLVGDAYNPQMPQLEVPTDYVQAKVNVQFGSEPEIATDQTFADVDEDGLPDFPIGRMSADSPSQLRSLVTKILDYETSKDFGSWRRRVDLTAGTGGFGPVIDGIIETAAKQMITELIPHDYETTMTYGSWSSPYCPDPRRFSQTAINSLNRGGLFWVYIGHGHPLRLDRMRVPGGEFPIFEDGDDAKLNCHSGQPIGLMLSCYTGAFDFREDCLAETMVSSPGGPVAMICGSRVTMPYAMSLLTLEMMQDYFDVKGEKTLGQLFYIAKRRMISSETSGGYRKMIETLGKTFSPTNHLLDEELQEHIYLFHIIGDPLLTLHRPAQVRLDIGGDVVNGNEISVEGVSEIAGELKVELVYRRDRSRYRPQRRKEFVVDHDEFMKYHETYQKSNNRVCDISTQTIKKGDFSLKIQIPEEASGDCVVRAYVAGAEKYAMGSKPVFVKKIRR